MDPEMDGRAQSIRRSGDYAALIPANRLTYEGKWDEARKLYNDAAARNPQSPLIKYWQAYLDFASGNAERAMPAFTALANGGRTVPDNLRASSLLYMARTHDLAGRRDAAKKIYQQIVDSYENQRAASAARGGSRHALQAAASSNLS